MEISLFLTFLFAATTWARRDRMLYSEVNGTFNVFYLSSFIDADQDAFPDSGDIVPVFRFYKGGVYTVIGDVYKALGRINGSLALGSAGKIKPIKLTLNRHSRVTNFGGMTRCVNSTEKSKPQECLPINLYFSSPLECSKRERAPFAAFMDGGDFLHIPD